MIVSRARQLPLLVVVVLIELIDAATIALHLLAHAEVDTRGTKRPLLLVRVRAGRGNLLFGLVVEQIDMDLFHIAATKAHPPAFRSGDIRTESLWLSRVANG